MTGVLDVWRAVDPSARLASGSVERLNRPVRGLERTRAMPPHLPRVGEGQLLIVDAAIVPEGRLDQLVAALRDAELDPSALWIAGEASLEPAHDEIPVLHGATPAAILAGSVTAYLEDERGHLYRVAADLRLTAAEAALGDPQPSAPAGIVAARIRRGVAVAVGGALASLNPRPAGRALATRFAAAHGRLAPGRAFSPEPRRTADGLWTVERRIGADASAWLFDDLPFARVDEVAVEALAITLRALLRRRPTEPARSRREPRLPPSTGDPLRDTLIAVARANGRIAPAARSLGVHRNTVLYRLHRAEVEYGLDPRRPDDALRLLREADSRN